MNRRPRIALVHNRCMPYREELFTRLSEEWDIDFFFARQRDIPIPVRHKVFRAFRIPQASEYEIVPGLIPELLRRGPYDVYNSTDVSYFITHVTYAIARLKRRPFVLWNGEWMQTAHPRRYLMRPLENHIIRRSASCIAYGSKARDFLVDRGAGRDRVYLAYNSVPPPSQAVSPADVQHARKQLGLDGKTVVLFLGRLVRFKGVEYLVRAFGRVKREHPDAALLIAGSGPEEGKLRRLVRELGVVDVFITGEPVDDRHKALYLTMADLFVLPSIYFRNPEPWGLVLNEAAAYGKPLVATDMVGAASDLIAEGKNGFIVQQRTTDSLAGAISSLLSDGDARAAMGNASKEMSRRFTVAQMATAIGGAFERAMAGVPARGAV